jgi:hypothetical protein
MHFCVTIFVAFFAFGSAMGASPTHNPTDDLRFADRFFWFWQTGPAVLYHVFGLREIAFLASFAWSMLIGFAAGLLLGRRKREVPNTAAQKTASQSSGLQR